MSDIMAFAALGETLMNRFGVRLAMAVGAQGNGLVLVLVTEHTFKSCMLHIAGPQLIEDGAMAGCTEIRWCLRTVSQGKGLMRLVTGGTVLGGDLIRVGLVALGALRNHLVFVGMTEITGLQCVLAGECCHFLTLVGVTCEAFLLELALKGDVAGSMGVVATQAILKLVVGLSTMTVAALGNIIGNLGTMTGMAVLAVDLVPVRQTLGGDLCGLRIMTFHAIRHHKLYSILRQYRSGSGKNQPDRCERKQSPPQLPTHTIHHLKPPVLKKNYVAGATTVSTSPSSGPKTQLLKRQKSITFIIFQTKYQPFYALT